MNSKILIFIFTICFIVTHTIFATNVPAGNVSGNWTQANSPYLILGNITVPQNSLLQIDPGVVVQFQGHYQLLINGRILSTGSSGNPIVFNAVTDWWGIRFDGISSSQDSSLFIYCDIQKGNANGTGNYAYGGAFFISNFSKIRVEHCTVTNNTATHGGAFYFDHANPKIYSNVINYNVATSYYGGGIYCTYSSPSILNNTITHNGGQIDCINFSSPDIIGNTISNSSGYGIECQYSSAPLIQSNIISHNSLGIVLVGCSANIINNLITYNIGNNYGSGIFSFGTASPNIINNTIAYNSAQQYGGGICLNGNNTPIIKNTILWANNAPQGDQISLQTTATPSFFNCDIQSGSTAFYYWDMPNAFSGTYINNIDANPIFINASLNDFTLQAASPCIDAGDTMGINLPSIDLAGNARVCNNVIEIGAYEICSTGINEVVSNKLNFKVFPNPSLDYLTVEISENDFQNNLRLRITNAIGDLIKDVSIYSAQTKFSIVELSSGIYFYQVTSAEAVMGTGKVIVK